MRPTRAVFAAERHVEVQATWGIYQRTVAAYRNPDLQLFLNERLWFSPAGVYYAVEPPPGSA